MSNGHQSAAEAKAKYETSMGTELGGLYAELWQQLASLHVNWNEFVVLFGTRQERIELLNKAAPGFFRIVQDTLWRDVLMHIARLTDRAQTAGKPNLSIQRLPELIKEASVRANVEDLVAKAVTATEFCRDWRNRHIAHRDLNLAMRRGVNPLLPASRLNVTEALQHLSAVLDAVSTYYLKSTTAFTLSAATNGAESLLYILDDGIKAAEARRQRRHAGQYLSADYNRDPL